MGNMLYNHHANNKLQNEDIISMREEHKKLLDGFAKKYHIHINTVKSILLYRTWRGAVKNQYTEES